MKRVLIWFGFAWLALCVSPACLHGETEKEAREFVARCIADPGILVAALSGKPEIYPNVSEDELFERRLKVEKNGTLLLLYDSGLPCWLFSVKDSQLDGANRWWDGGGRVISEELWDNGKLRSGKYLGAKGEVLGEVRDGTGMRIGFDQEPGLREGMPGISSWMEYKDGVGSGRWVSAIMVGNEPGWYVSTWQGENGVSIRCKKDGTLTERISYRNGKKEGEEITWHPNGNVRSISWNREGRLAGNGSIYSENGQKREEVVYEDGVPVWKLRWHPEGGLLSWMRQDPETGQVMEGQSFDLDGTQNGSVRKGAGRLMNAAIGQRWGDGHELAVFRSDGVVLLESLPMLHCGPARISDGKLTLRLHLRGGGGRTRVDCELLPLPGAARAEPCLLEFGKAEWEPALALPEGVDEWTGPLYARIRLTDADGGVMQYTQAFWPAGTRQPEASPPPEPLFRIAQASSDDLINNPGEPRVEDLPDGAKVTVPPEGAGVQGWRVGQERWLLYAEPPVLLKTVAGDEKWKVAKRFDFVPSGMLVRSPRWLLVYGMRATATPEKGMPHVALVSRDGGRRWRDFPIPKFDFLRSIEGGQDGSIQVTGAVVPEGGMPARMEWPELSCTRYGTEDEGKHYTVLRKKENFVRPEKEGIFVKATSPDGMRAAYTNEEGAAWCIVVGNPVYVSARLGEVPRLLLYAKSLPQFEWSGNSQVLAMKWDGVYFGFHDLRTGGLKYANVSRVQAERTVEEEKQLTEMHERVMAMLEREK